MSEDQTTDKDKTDYYGNALRDLIANGHDPEYAATVAAVAARLGEVMEDVLKGIVAQMDNESE